MDEQGKTTEKKKYSVVDKRFDIDEIEPADAPPPPPAPPAAEQAPPEPEAAADAGDAAQGEDDRQERDYRIEDAVRLALGTIREQALFALGLIIKKNRSPKQNMDKIARITKIFNELSDKFADVLAAEGAAEPDQPEPTIQEVVIFIFNMLNGQVMMHLGLIPNPVTNLSVRDLSQAKLGIDFCAALLEAARSEVDPALAKQLEAVISEMRMAFVNLK